MSLLIVMYHYVRDLQRSRYPAINGLDVSLFKTQLEWLNANYTVIRMEDVTEALSGGRVLPENAALLTFDDGYIDHYTMVLPLLSSMGLQGTFFPPGIILESAKLLDANKAHIILASGKRGVIYDSLIKKIDYYRGKEFDIPDTQQLIDEYALATRFDDAQSRFIKQMLHSALPKNLRNIIADKLLAEYAGTDESVLAREFYCDAQQLRMMKRCGMHIGVHGYSHDKLGDMTEDEYKRDINRALDCMSSAGLIDTSAWVLNYPYGSWSDGVVEFAGSAGCLAGFTTQFKDADLANDNRLLLPRFDTGQLPPVSEKYKDYCSNKKRMQ